MQTWLLKQLNLGIESFKEQNGWKEVFDGDFPVERIARLQKTNDFLQWEKYCDIRKMIKKY